MLRGFCKPAKCFSSFDTASADASLIQGVTNGCLVTQYQPLGRSEKGPFNVPAGRSHNQGGGGSETRLAGVEWLEMRGLICPPRRSRRCPPVESSRGHIRSKIIRVTSRGHNSIQTILRLPRSRNERALGLDSRATRKAASCAKIMRSDQSEKKFPTFIVHRPLY